MRRAVAVECEDATDGLQVEFVVVVGGGQAGGGGRRRADRKNQDGDGMHAVQGDVKLLYAEEGDGGGNGR